jgi:nucleoside-diphosphate-sugar epimerase
VKIFVTGADGFIGQHLCARLERRSFAVTRAVRRLSGSPPGANSVATGDLATNDGLSALLAGHDAIVHLAGRAHVLHETEADPRAEYQRANVETTIRVAEAAAAAQVRRVVFLSSIGVLGDRSNHALTEQDPVAPAELYADSKLRAEQALREIARRTALEAVVLRATLTYGPRCPGNMARLMRLVARGTPLPFASIEARRSFIGVDNLNGLIELALAHPAAAGETFVVADGEDITLPDLLKHLAAGMSMTARLFPCPRALLELGADLVGHHKAFEKLTASLRVDATKARRVLGWSPEVSLADGLRATAAAFADNAAVRTGSG